MEPDTRDTEASGEYELATTIKYLDLYFRQKTDLFLQHYVFEPFDLLGKKLIYLSLVVTLLAAGTLVVFAGVILLIATILPLWAALLLTGAIIFLLAGIIASVFFSKQIILQTPTALEMMNRGKT
jgi:hypothetical protein